MLPSIRDKKTGYIYKLSKKLECKIDRECDAELRKISNKPASDSEDEPESHVCAATNTPIFTSLKMTCSDSEDSLEASGSGCSVSQASDIKNQPEAAKMSHEPTLGNECSSREPTIAKVLNILMQVSKHVKKMNGATDLIQTDVGNISNRLTKIEETVDTSVATLERMKDEMKKKAVCLKNRDSNSVALYPDFKKVSSEEELMECDSKLGNDVATKRNYVVSAEPNVAQEDILKAIGDSLRTEVKITCSDREDSSGTSTVGRCSVPPTNQTNSHPNHQTEPKEPSMSDMFKLLTTVSDNIKDMQEKTESIQREVVSISDRLAQVESKVEISLATMDQRYFGNGANTAAAFSFEPISSEEELMECDSKLGSDVGYYGNVLQWLRLQIDVPDPDNRLHLAMDLVFERSFLPLCSWTGNGRPAPKIALRGRTNVLKLFADIGSNQNFTTNELFVQKFFFKKLPHAKNRTNLLGRATSCHKRKPT
ncbi:uncharacterized protein LOC128303043 [Anopheles moucheti]|uniref:uncharacterized protein LOC128303043 n=1 Tax=Anopheles moucheti TaxID=186751 RepID=UPI0022F11F6C|nr:uncharacterized protein LOC128303043 [Anopheles moucheti]